MKRFFKRMIRRIGYEIGWFSTNTLDAINRGDSVFRVHKIVVLESRFKRNKRRS